MAANSKVVDLRKLLAARFPSLPNEKGNIFPSGQALLDANLGGGLRKGAITEISSPAPSAGTASLTADLVEAAAEKGHFIALIDGRDSFDPATLPPEALRHLLWVRCQEAGQAFKAADLLLRDGNFPLVLLDLVLNPPNELRHIPTTSWYRLQRLTETSSIALLVMSRHSVVASAHVKLILLNQWCLQTFAQANARSRLRLKVTRAHDLLLARAG